MRVRNREKERERERNRLFFSYKKMNYNVIYTFS